MAGLATLPRTALVLVLRKAALTGIENKLSNFQKIVLAIRFYYRCIRIYVGHEESNNILCECGWMSDMLYPMIFCGNADGRRT